VVETRGSTLEEIERVFDGSKGIGIPDLEVGNDGRIGIWYEGEPANQQHVEAANKKSH
jgi:hypothetical protein